MMAGVYRRTLERSSDRSRPNVIQGVIERIMAKGIIVVVCKPSMADGAAFFE